MKPSIWMLYIGIFMCAAGIGLVGGLIMIALWFYNDYNNKIDKRQQTNYYALGPDQRNLA